jgi:DNA-binding transcriptional LysR family regulator
MDEITSLRVFLEVARRKSFARTAEHFGMSPAAVSKHLAALERSLQTRLMNRTTKQMSLTPAGEQVIESATAVLSELEHMHRTVADLSRELSGTVRVGVAPYFGAHRLVPVVASFSRQYPDVKFSVTLLSKQRIEAFVSEGLDIGVVMTPRLQDASHGAHELAVLPQVLVAAPAYLRAAPALRVPADLAQHACLVNVYKTATGTWRFGGAAGATTVRVDGPLRSNYADALKQAAVSGMGISMHPRYLVAEELAKGVLQEVLPDYPPEALTAYAIFSTRGAMPARVRAFLDYLRQWAGTHGNWPMEG